MSALLEEDLTLDSEESFVASNFLMKTSNKGGWEERKTTTTKILVEDSIIVGFDGSLLSHKALNWGVNYAKVFDIKLIIISGHEAYSYHGNVVAPHIWNSQFRKSIQDNLDYVIDKSIGTSPNVDIQKIVAFGEPSQILATFSRGALLLIIGHKGQNRHNMGTSMGSVADYCVRYASCPVLVYRERGYYTQFPILEENMIK